ncbi:unnamed protein product [Symbiodinium sp. CCMP2592]|nr:unnamed protein product [Symbiodinium sp. CCMP2592]
MALLQARPGKKLELAKQARTVGCIVFFFGCALPEKETALVKGGFVHVPSSFKAPWAYGGSRVIMLGSHGNTMAVLSGAAKPQGVQVAGFLTEDGIASQAMETANKMAGVMSDHIALQRDQLRVQERMWAPGQGQLSQAMHRTRGGTRNGPTARGIDVGEQGGPCDEPILVKQGCNIQAAS